MATIALYKDKINRVGFQLESVINSSDKLSSQLNVLKNTLQGVDSSTCDLQDAVDSITSSTKSESDKVEDVRRLNTKLSEFINTAVERDDSARSEIVREKNEFYEKYSYLKPDCEKKKKKNLAQKLVAAVKKVCNWCKEHWKEIVIAIELVVAVVCLFVPGMQVVSAAILTHMMSGALFGLKVGIIVGAISGYAQEGVGGILKGALSGAKDGFLMGAAFGGLGGLGAGLGTIGKCSTAINTIFNVSSGISIGMQGFDVLALLDMTLMRLSKDLGFNYKGGQVATANANVHSNPFYNVLQMGVGFASAFTGGYKSKAKCFVAGTLVLTANGVVAIEMIKVGDLVYAAHEETLEYGIRPVVETYVRETDKLVHITVNGEEIVSTFDHPYYIKGKGFVNASDLCIGYELIDNNGNNLVVEQIFCEKLNDEKVKVYNFQVEEYHTYCVGYQKVLVHNATYSQTSLDTLENTENFTEQSLRHIFEGEINIRGKAVGYHYEGIENSAGGVVEGTRTTPRVNGVYEGQVSVNDIPKTANGGMSTFFPEDMTPQQVVDCINEAYSNKTLVSPAPAPGMNSTYQGTTTRGIEVTIYINDAGKIVSAFPGGN